MQAVQVFPLTFILAIPPDVFGRQPVFQGLVGEPLNVRHLTKGTRRNPLGQFVSAF